MAKMEVGESRKIDIEEKERDIKQRDKDLSKKEDTRRIKILYGNRRRL